MRPNAVIPGVVLLDWDGTLLNSYASDRRAYLAMFRALGIDWGVTEIERHYSPNWYRVYEAAGIPRRDWSKADRLWRRAYARERPALLPGVRSVLHWLRTRYLLGVVSSGSGSRVRRQIRHFGFREHFSACVCGEDTPKRKPHPAPLELALRRLHARREQCVYVGDAPEDIAMARTAGVRAVGVLGPFPTAARTRAEGPDAMLDSVRELPGYLRSLTHELRASGRKRR